MSRLTTLVEVVKCQYCKKIFAGCVASERDHDWFKKLAEYKGRGDIVELISAKEARLEWCDCKEKEMAT